MSFVSKVLEHTGQLERRAVYEDMETLIQKKRELQLEVHQLAENKFSQFHPSLSDSKKLHLHVEDVRKNIVGLEDKINCEIKGQLTLSTAEFQSLTQQLSESKAIGESLERLAQMYNSYETSVDALNNQKYSEAVAALNEVNRVLQQQDDKIEILAIETMKNEAFVQRLKVEQEMAEMWADCVKWNYPKTQQQNESMQKEDSNRSSVSLSIGKEGCDKSTLKELVEGLQMTNLLNLRMKTFAEKFNKFIIPLILEPCDVEVKMSSSAKGINTLSINMTSDNVASTSNSKGKRGQQTEKPESKQIPEDKLYSFVFDRLVRVLESLHEMMLSVESGNTEEQEGEGNLMSLLGRETSESLLENLQKDILAKAIPTTAKDLAGFENVKSATNDLQEKLVTLGYISSSCHSLKDSVENVNLLFSNKKCALILEQARDLMTSDLLNGTTTVSDNKPQGDWPMLSAKSSEKGKKPEALSDKLLSSETFKMPDCQVSENVTMLMQLAYTTLHEATESSPECATQMYFAVHNMFELFRHVVSTHHKQNIEKLPQMSALHHNNCMYITHHLMTLGHQFALALPSSETATFVPLIQHIREDGWDSFVAQVKRQKDILLECLEEAEGFLSVEEDSHREKCERSIKQVLHQLKHLHKVWEPVLPINLYQKAMGKLIQAVVERVTDCITAIEDITQDACGVLTKLLGQLEEGSALVMGISVALLPCHVQNWPRHTNIKTVFNSNLLTIDNLWADGKGPLALTFSAVEMKQMIRALFQNTERRADLLSKIR